MSKATLGHKIRAGRDAGFCDAGLSDNKRKAVTLHSEPCLRGYCDSQLSFAARIPLLARPSSHSFAESCHAGNVNVIWRQQLAETELRGVAGSRQAGMTMAVDFFAERS